MASYSRPHGYPEVLPRVECEKESSDEDQPPFMLKQLLSSRTLLIAKPVDRELMEKVATSLMILEADDAEKPITVLVNSPGGDADSGFAIYDLLRFCKSPVRTICAGLAASAGVPIFLGGDRGERFSLPNSRFLLHQPSMQMMGQASDLQITADEITKIRTKYNRIIAEETGQTEEKILADVNRDFWLSAEEAVEYGLVNRVVAHRGELD
jgi:ATP-dependent Clp protease protease subunit